MVQPCYYCYCYCYCYTSGRGYASYTAMATLLLQLLPLTAT